jgi:hypothetical protein
MARWFSSLYCLLAPRSTATAVVTTALALLPVMAQGANQPPLPDKIKFNRDVRPIFSETCLKCHGFDAKERKADLRLDTREGALAALKHGAHAIVPGDAEKSEAIRRIETNDADELMPPPKSGKVLTPHQKAILRKWVDQGAEYEAHWAFVAPVRPPVPEIAGSNWSRNAIDRFVLDRLNREGLKPSPEADKATLIRRVTLDLTGLPPTLSEVEGFVTDQSPDAYEKLVDRLLASPRYGERLAVDWLDAARFADTHGYHIDAGRDMTHWRDWVINAFNKNKAYDQFVVEQLAGDLLPNATADQKIASGFNRNHMINFEGGADPNEYHTAYLIDRVNTTSTVFLGLTVACSQCHDHKYDPITQRDFYSLYAFFNNVPENGLDGRTGNAAPLLKLPTQEQKEKLEQLTADVKRVEAELSGPALAAAQKAWEESLGKPTNADGGAAAWTTLEPTEMKSASGAATFTKREDGSISVGGEEIPNHETYTITAPTGGKDVTGVRIETVVDDTLPAGGPGRSENGNAVLTDVKVSLNDAAVKLSAASADFSQQDFPVSLAIDDKKETGWAIYPKVGEPHNATFTFEKPVNGSTITVTLAFQSIYSRHQFGRFRLSVTDSKEPVKEPVKALPFAVAEAVKVAPEQRSEKQSKTVRDYFVKTAWLDAKRLNSELEQLKKSLAQLEKKIPSSMVMEEMPKPRDTFLLMRGQFDKPGDKVTAAVPAFLPPIPKDAPPNRLGLALWLVDPSQPLLTRVTVNRYWQMFFGTGIVKTAEDFGSQGELPTHPELLDWLAVEFRESGWDVRKLVREIVTSSAYRQSSKVTPELLQHDPENRLLARGPRFRLQAEFIRDQALAVSNLLDSRIGGASVSPYQPAGLWEELMSRDDGANWTAQTYVQSHGPDLYRRTMYTFWKRTSPPPTLQTFDAPDREVCTVRRARTNTPLQALVLMNDPTYVEAARKLAERVMREGGDTTATRVAFAFKTVMVRVPTEKELAVLTRICDEQLKAYAPNEEAAKKVLAVGESPRDEKLPVTDLAGWTIVCNAILNLDEAITRN